MIRRFLLTTLLLSAGLAAGAVPDAAPDAPSPETGPLAELVRRELTRRLGPASDYSVRIDRVDPLPDGSRIGPVEVIGTDVRTEAGIVLSRLEIRLEPVELRGFALDRESLQGEFSAWVDEPEVARLVRRELGSRVDGLRVDLRPGRVRLSGRPELFGLRAPAEVEGRLRLTRRERVLFRAESVRLVGIEIPDLVAERLEERVNPLIDLGRLRLPVRFRRLAIRRDALLLEGSAALDRDPPAARRQVPGFRG